MVSTSLKLHSAVLGAVLVLSASYAAASSFPVMPFPPIPTGVKAVASSFPVMPFPPIPTGVKTVASSFPVMPFPPIPTGVKA